MPPVFRSLRACKRGIGTFLIGNVGAVLLMRECNSALGEGRESRDANDSSRMSDSGAGAGAGADEGASTGTGSGTADEVESCTAATDPVWDVPVGRGPE